MQNKGYVPEPIDTGEVRLPDEIVGLSEILAKNVHENWSARRIAEGWTYGEKKDQEKKTTPLLVSYEKLPESEREYDRATMCETLKLLMKLGYRIERQKKI